MRAFKNSHIEKPSPITVALFQDPWGMMLGLFFFLLGVYTLVSIGTGGAVANSKLLDNALTKFGLFNWAISLAIGGVLMIGGRITQKPPMEAAGLGFVVYASAVYAVVVLFASGLAGIVAAGAYVTIGTAAIIRLVVIRKDRQARKVAGQILNGNSPYGGRTS